MSYDLALMEALSKIAKAVQEVNINFDAQTILDALKEVDGEGSGLDADMVDGQHVGYNHNLETRDVHLRQQDCRIEGGDSMGFFVGDVKRMSLLGDVVNIAGELVVNGQYVCVGCSDIVSLATPAYPQVVPPETWTVVEYGMIVYNPVGAYNSATYKFIAPDDGFYHVQAAVNLKTEEIEEPDKVTVKLGLFRNGVNLRILDENYAKHYLNGGCDVQLFDGNDIDIRMWHNAKSSITTYRYYDRYNRFSVHKI